LPTETYNLTPTDAGRSFSFLKQSEDTFCGRENILFCFKRVKLLVGIERKNTKPLRRDSDELLSSRKKYGQKEKILNGRDR